MRPQYQAAPEHRRRDRKRREEIPGEVVSEDRQVEAEKPEDVDDRDELAFPEAEQDDAGGERDVLQPFALTKEADERQHREAREDRQVQGLRPHDLAPAGRLVRFVLELPLSAGGLSLKRLCVSRCARGQECRKAGDENECDNDPGQRAAIIAR